MRALATLRAIRASALAPPFVTNALTNNPRTRAGYLRILHEHPERIDRLTALGDTAALRASTAFAPTIRAGRDFAWNGAQPTVPVTVAWGELDRILPLRQAQRAARLLPRADHLTLAGCGHVPMIDAPERVAEVILDTCARADATTHDVA